jgi:hypothetical protein
MARPQLPRCALGPPFPPCCNHAAQIRCEICFSTFCMRMHAGTRCCNDQRLPCRWCDRPPDPPHQRILSLRNQHVPRIQDILRMCHAIQLVIAWLRLARLLVDLQVDLVDLALEQSSWMLQYGIQLKHQRQARRYVHLALHSPRALLS